MLRSHLTKLLPVGVVVSSLVLGAVGGPAAAAKARHAPRPLPITKKTAAQILSMATATENQQRSVHVSGSLEEPGTVAVGLNLELGGEGEGYGTLTEYGSTIKVLKSGTQIYVNAPSSFWSKFGGAADGKLYGSHWVVATNQGSYNQLNLLMTQSSLVRTLFPPSLGPLTKNKVRTINGHLTMPLSVGGLKHSAHVLYVSAKGRPTVTEVVSKSGAATGSFTFSRYSAPRSFAAPLDSISPAQSVTLPSAPTTTTTAPKAKPTTTTTKPKSGVTIVRTNPTTTTFYVTPVTTCPSGAVSGTIVVNGSQNLIGGGYTIRANGTITNDTTATVDNVVVTWTVNYNGEVDTYSTDVAFGTPITPGQSAPWDSGPIEAPSAPTAPGLSVAYSFASPYSACPT